MHVQSVSALVMPHVRDGARWHVLSVHRHACNFVTESGQLVALVSPRLGRGPFHLLLSEDVDFHHVCAHAPVLHVRSGRLVLGHHTIPTSPQEVWDPQVRWPPHGEGVDLLRKVATQVLSEREEKGRLLRLIRQRIDEGIAAVKRALREGDVASVARGVAMLAGLGPGLTPAGDDALLGLLAAVQAAGPSSMADMLSRAVRQHALPHTTQLSATWLRYALARAYSEPWHRVVRAWEQGDTPALAQAFRHILGIGATSGYYALVGFTRGIE
ncbi:MAG: DUF2877 domain-containing protein [Chloroflexi bacterium]|nr:DUF2877 domain-containing protein [Chloroflexota bacterium]